jgi:hypothetical protein
MSKIKQIALSQGKVALASAQDYDYLAQWKWCAQKSGNRFYAVRHDKDDHKVIVSMHVSLLGSKLGFEIDHINGNGLDNRRTNLRHVTHRENQQNLHINKTSKYPGVCWHKANNCWKAYIRYHKHRHSSFLGYFTTQELAYEAYKHACEFGCPEFPPELLKFMVKREKITNAC